MVNNTRYCDHSVELNPANCKKGKKNLGICNKPRLVYRQRSRHLFGGFYTTQKELFYTYRKLIV